MTLLPLNSTPVELTMARGYMAPYVRVATHLGYCIAWISATSDAEWIAPEEESTATRDRVRTDLLECENHLNQTDYVPTAFVGDECDNHMTQIKEQVSELARALPEVRSDALIEVQTLTNNLAYAAASFERHTTGNRDVSEGRNA